MIEEIKKAYFIAKKDMGAYYLKPPLISWGLMLPIVFVLAFYFRNPTGIKEVVPGLIGLTLLFSCTSMAAIVITFEKRIGALETAPSRSIEFQNHPFRQNSWEHPFWADGGRFHHPHPDSTHGAFRKTLLGVCSHLHLFRPCFLPSWNPDLGGSERSF